MANRPFAIFYIDANKAYFYGSNMASMLQIDIPADTMSYFDILNKDKFYQIIQNFVTTNKIEPVPLLILISPHATYEKDIISKTPEETRTETQQFLDAVPFDKVLSKTYKIQDANHFVATNKDLYEYIRHGFEKVHFTTTAVVSFLLLQKVMPELGPSLNLDVVAGKFDAIRQYSFITHEEINNPGKPMQHETDTNKPNPVRLFGLIGVFVVLLGILAFMLVTTLRPQPVTKPPTIPQAPVIYTSPAISPTPTILPTQAINRIATPSSIIVSPVTR